MTKIDFKNSTYIFIIAIIALESIKIQNFTFDGIRDLLINLSFLIGYLFIYLGWRNRILLINYFWTLFYFNIQLTTNKLVGMYSLTGESVYMINKTILVFIVIGFVFLILGIVKRKFKYLSDNFDYPIKKILLISFIFTTVTQLFIRLIQF